MFLKQVELTNVRCLRSLTLPLEMRPGTTRKWTLLLGDNGVGKSTLMRSIGLVLAGSSALAELIGDPDSWVHVGEKATTTSTPVRSAIRFIKVTSFRFMPRAARGRDPRCRHHRHPRHSPRSPRR